MSTLTTDRQKPGPRTGNDTVAIAHRGAPPATEPVLHVMTRDEYRSMTHPQATDPLLTTMRLVGRAVRLLFSRQDAERSRALGMELARSTSPCNGLDDPVRTWEHELQIDRGLGRARRLQRLVNSPVWRGEQSGARSVQNPSEQAADCLFATVMNLTHQMPLSDEAHLFRLWYLATRAVNPPENATRLFGELRHLPEHQQLAAGARMLAMVMDAATAHSPSHPQLHPLHAIALPSSD